MSAKLTRYRCALCGRRLREGAYVYSRWTGNRYCATIDCKTKRKRRSST